MRGRRVHSLVPLTWLNCRYRAYVYSREQSLRNRNRLQLMLLQVAQAVTLRTPASPFIGPQAQQHTCRVEST